MSKSVVLTICEEYGITAEEFFGPRRDWRLTHARRVAIERLVEAGLNGKGIAAAIRRNYSTVQYWLHPEYREQRSAYAAKYHAAHPVPRTRKLTQEKCRILVEAYVSGGINAAKPIAIQYGINPQTVSRYTRLAGIKGKPGRPKRIILNEIHA